MRAGEFGEGERTLRAKVDLASPNFNMRDPVMYRIVKAAHHRTGDAWCIYPMYDWAHGLEDAIERITHSVCTLEFEHHKPLYNWFLDQIDEFSAPGAYRPQQYEFARLNLTYTVMSKRKLLELVKSNLVTGWDDPRMPTIRGLRRRGYTAESIRAFCREIGVAKMNSMIDVVKLENSLRDDLNKNAQRRMAVLNPVKLVIENYPENVTEMIEAVNNPENEADGTRQVPFSKVLFIERDDFMEDAPVTCTGCEKDAAGNVTEVRCTYDPETRGGSSADGRKVQGTIHWVSAEQALDAEVRLYDRLFTKENPDDPQDPTDYKEYLNKHSLEKVTAKIEPSLCDARPGQAFFRFRSFFDRP